MPLDSSSVPIIWLIWFWNRWNNSNPIADNDCIYAIDDFLNMSCHWCQRIKDQMDHAEYMMSKDQRSYRSCWICDDKKSKESDWIAKRLPLTQPAWRNTYGRMQKSHESNCPTMTLVANAYIIINIEEHWKWQRCANTWLMNKEKQNYV